MRKPNNGGSFFSVVDDHENGSLKESLLPQEKIKLEFEKSKAELLKKIAAHEKLLGNGSSANVSLKSYATYMINTIFDDKDKLMEQIRENTAYQYQAINICKNILNLKQQVSELNQFLFEQKTKKNSIYESKDSVVSDSVIVELCNETIRLMDKYPQIKHQATYGV